MLFSSPTLFRIHIFPYPLFHFNLSPSSSTFIETTVPLLSFSSHSSKLTYPPFPISPFYLHQSLRFSLFTFPIFIPKLPFLPLLLIRRPYLSNNRLKISAKKTSLSAPSCSTCSSQSHEHRLVVFLCYLFASENNFASCLEEEYLILYFNLFVRLRFTDWIPLQHFFVGSIYSLFHELINGWLTEYIPKCKHNETFQYESQPACLPKKITQLININNNKQITEDNYHEQ